MQLCCYFIIFFVFKPAHQKDLPALRGQLGDRLADLTKEMVEVNFHVGLVKARRMDVFAHVVKNGCFPEFSFQVSKCLISDRPEQVADIGSADRLVRLSSEKLEKHFADEVFCDLPGINEPDGMAAQRGIVCPEKDIHSVFWVDPEHFPEKQLFVIFTAGRVRQVFSYGVILVFWIWKRFGHKAFSHFKRRLENLFLPLVFWEKKNIFFDLNYDGPFCCRDDASS